MKNLKGQLVSLENEKNELKENVLETKRSTQQTIESLKEECNKMAKARALQSELAGRHDAEVRAEVARLHDVSSPEGHGAQDGSAAYASSSISTIPRFPTSKISSNNSGRPLRNSENLTQVWNLTSRACWHFLPKAS